MTPPSAPTADPARVELHGVGRFFGDGTAKHTVLTDLDLEIPAGSTVAVLGPSGSGKSTLLRLVAGLDQPSTGTVLVDGEPVRDMHRRAAVMFQDARLMAWRSLAANVAFGLPPGSSRAAGRAEVRRWLEIVGLAGFERHRPSQLSGGMAQRAALARALVRRPGVLLLDEPFAALDALTRLRMQDLLDDLQRAARTTVLLVTHDVEEAIQLADQIVLLGPLSGTARGPTTISAVLDVQAPRPRDRDDPALLPLRSDLLRRLGVARSAVPIVSSKEPVE